MYILIDFHSSYIWKVPSGWPTSKPHLPVKLSISSKGTGLFQSTIVSLLSSMLASPQKYTQWSGYIFMQLTIMSNPTSPRKMKAPFVSEPLALIYPDSEILNFWKIIGFCWLSIDQLPLKLFRTGVSYPEDELWSEPLLCAWVDPASIVSIIEVLGSALLADRFGFLAFILI